MHTQVYNSFSSFVTDIVAKYGNNKAMGFVNEEYITYAEMGKKISAVQSFVTNLGLNKGDKAIIYSQNMPNWGIVYLALQCSGIVVVPVLPDFSTNELENVIKHSESKAIFLSKNLRRKLDETDSSTLDTVIMIEDFSIVRTTASGVIFDDNAESNIKHSPQEDEMSVLLYTSGTTGNSKGVMLSQKNILTNIVQCSHVQEIKEHYKFLSILPLAHTYENTIGLLLALCKGANITYLQKPPTPSILLPVLKSLQPEIMNTVPLIIEKIYKSSIIPGIQKNTVTRILHKFKPTKKLVNRLAGKKLYETFGGKLVFFGIGGAKLDGTVESFLRDAKFPYAIGYGLTESAPLIAGSNPSQTKLQAIGPKVIDCEVKIHNPNPKNGEGEIWARGANIMLGYYKNAKETAKVLTKDGWFKTGDLGVFDKNGWLSHKGRTKNMIVGANGENIYPEEIESIINNFRHVVESIVVEKKGKLVAMVHFNREELEKRVQEMKDEVSSLIDEKMEAISQKVDEKIDELSIELQQYINERVNKFSRVQLVIAQPTPFQKTATHKIKRYLYS
jgi:long-chain acyl-CoA synthetase